jgi:endonuclease YncB( thermonuclease family)
MSATIENAVAIMQKKTQSDKVREQNAKANRKIRQNLKDNGELHQLAAGKPTKEIGVDAKEETRD